MSCARDCFSRLEPIAGVAGEAGEAGLHTIHKHSYHSMYAFGLGLVALRTISNTYLTL